MYKRLEQLSPKARRRLSNLLIVGGVLIVLFPLLTEAYGYYKSLDLVKAWESQAQNQKASAEKVSKEHDKLVAQGQLPNEESILGSTPGKTGAKIVKQQKPFPKTKIIIPKIAVNQVVMEGTSPAILKFGPGHYTGMANPGDKGNVGIAGHRVTYTHPFNRLDELSEGDKIILETVDYVYEYRVERKVVVDPKDVSTLRPTRDAIITLTTCNPKYSARTRLNVQGVLVNTRPQRDSLIRIVRSILSDDDKKEQHTKRPKTYAELLEELKVAQRNAEKNPVSLDANIKLAKAYMALEVYDEAVAPLKRAELINPREPAVKELFARVNAKKEKLRRDLAAAERNPGSKDTLDPMLYVELGHIHMALGEYAEAADIFDKGIDLYPYAADAHVFKGLALEKMEQDGLAIAAYKQALVYDPASRDALDGIARINNKKPGSAPGPQSIPYRLRPQ